MNKIYSVIIILGIALSLVACSGAEKDASNTNIASTDLIAQSESNAIPEMGKSYEFEFNPYVLTSEYEQLYGDEFLQAYRNFVSSYLNYENYYSCPSGDYAYLISKMQQVNFPLFNADAYFDYDNFYNAQTGRVPIYYVSESKEQHDELISNFVDDLSEIIENNIMQNDNDVIKAITLYRAFSSSVSYNYDAIDNDMISDVSPYNALINRDGICQSFAGAYTYLLLQLGIDANTCGGMTYDNTSAHEWTILKLDGKYYYADPTFENTETGGCGLKYFGITTAEREEAGNFDPQYFNIGLTNEIWSRDSDISDTRFEPLRACLTFEIDHEENSVVCFDENGSEYIKFS
ncbi:transglutaminase domain-containing protein [Oscillospiraceae bacterium LTW-04]|nr:transglutaminase domain-containing protein [Oscillospiraceae bacterium MB24-C1]